MRMRMYLVWAAIAVAIKADNVRQAENFYEGNRLLEPIDVAADQETVSYLLPKLAAKYRPNNEWSGVIDPRFYLLTEPDNEDGPPQQTKLIPEMRSKRAGGLNGAGGSLSIVNSLDVLRNRLLLEIARKKAKEGASRNRQILINLGKRAFFSKHTAYDNNEV